MKVDRETREEVSKKRLRPLIFLARGRMRRVVVILGVILGMNLVVCLSVIL